MPGMLLVFSSLAVSEIVFQIAERLPRLKLFFSQRLQIFTILGMLFFTSSICFSIEATSSTKSE